MSDDAIAPLGHHLSPEGALTCRDAFARLVPRHAARSSWLA